MQNIVIGKGVDQLLSPTYPNGGIVPGPKGDRGDKGDTGAQGPQGVPGIGTVGPVGPAGPAPVWGQITGSIASQADLGSAATRNVGTSGATIPLLSSANTWSGSQAFAGWSASVGSGGLRASAGFANATPGLTAFSQFRSLALVVGTSGSALAYDEGGQFVIGTDTSANIKGDVTGNQIIATVTFASNRSTSFSGATSINASGQPLLINSTDSDAKKITFQSAGAFIGRINATTDYPFIVRSKADLSVLLVDNDGNLTLSGRSQHGKGLTIRSGSTLQLNNAGDTVAASLGFDGSAINISAPIISLNNVGKAIMRADENGGAFEFRNSGGAYLGQYNLQSSGMYMDAAGPQVLRSAAGVTRATFADGTISLTGRVNIDQQNTTNRYAIYIGNVGAGTTGIVLDRAGGGYLELGGNTGGQYWSLGAANRTMQFAVTNNAYDGSPQAFDFRNGSAASRRIMSLRHTDANATGDYFACYDSTGAQKVKIDSEGRLITPQVTIQTDNGGGFSVLDSSGKPFGGYMSLPSGTYIDSYSQLMFRGYDAPRQSLATWGSWNIAGLSVSGKVTGTSLNAQRGDTPSTLSDGDVWTTSAGLFVRINGVTMKVTATAV